MKKILVVLSILTSTLLPSRAGVVLSDTFDYPDGPIVGAPNSPWNSHSGTAGTMLVTNGQLVVSTSRSEDVNAVLAGGPYSTNDPNAVLFSRFTVTCTGFPTAAGTYFAHFKDLNTGAATGFGARVYASTTNAVAGTLLDPGKYRLGVCNGTSVSAAAGQFDLDLTTNVTYTVVTRFVPSTGLATIWIDPTSESDTSVTATDPGTSTRPNQIDVVSYAFRQASGEGTMWVDDLKVGTAFTDVAGANTAPTISAIPNQTAPAGKVIGPLSFTIGDAESAPDSLQVTASSSNTALVPETGVVLGGTGADRTVTVTPAAGQQGMATIRVTVSDGVNTSFTEFAVKIGGPYISPIAGQIVAANTPVPVVSFTIGDAESDPLTLTARSSNTDLLPDAGIVFGGSGSNRTATLTPTVGVVGVSTVTISVDDGFNTNSSTFTLTMKPLLGLVFSDNFAYTDFPLQASSGNHLYLATGSPWTTVSGTAFQVQVTNPLVYLSYTNTEDVGAALTNAPYAPSSAVVFYVGFTVNFSVLPSHAGNYFLHLKASDTDTLSFRAKVFASTANAPTDMFRLGVANVANAPVEFPMDLSLGATYAVVMRYNSGTGETVLWVNPASEQSAYAAAADSPSTGTVGGVGLREDTGIGNVALGALKIGTSFSDVFIATTPTEEPLQFGLQDGQLTLTWTNPAFSLTEASDVGGPYTKVDGAKSPYSTSAQTGTKFYRLVYP